MSPVLSITINDCTVQTFRSGGKGGQNQNKRDTGVRVIHPPSGAVGESREFRTQLENKRSAFKRMANHPKMTFWIHTKLHGQRFTFDMIKGMTVNPDDYKIEQKINGRWEELA